MSLRRPRVIALGLGAAAVLAYVVLWLQVDPFHIGRSDFTSTYVGATLLREGHGPQMYDESLQTPLHDRLIAPDHEGNLPFVNAPLGAAVAVPVSFLSLDTAYRIWSLLQFLLLVAAVVIAIRAAPGSRSLPPAQRLAFGLVALACLGTWTLLIQGQWDGVSALGLALAYAALRSQRPFAAGSVLAVSALIAKPHLAIGLAAFVVGRLDRRLLQGAVVGTLAAVALSTAVAGPGGVAGFVHAALTSTTRWELRNMLSFIGIAGTVAGNGVTAHIIGVAGTAACTVLAAVLGFSVRRSAARLEPALAGAAVLSLLASPHAYSHDLTLLVPAAAWALVTAARSSSRAALTAALTAWIAINVAAEVDITSGASVPPGQLAPWALIAAAALAARMCLPRAPRDQRAGVIDSPATSTPAVPSTVTS